jgi:hypothetical protein
MANDAFALSPISASATLPSADDYHAIHDAFMETSRGRWFLTEYARRNRNADTTMVLDAVARIEATVAAQKQATASTSIADNGEAVRAILAEAGGFASGAIDRFTEAQTFPAQRGLRIIREVAWRLREVGYDGRICDILDAQADLIGASYDAALTQELRTRVLEAFDTASQRILALSAPGAATDTAAEAATAPTEQPAPEVKPAAVAPQPDPSPVSTMPASAAAVVSEPKSIAPAERAIVTDTVVLGPTTAPEPVAAFKVSAPVEEPPAAEATVAPDIEPARAAKIALQEPVPPPPMDDAQLQAPHDVVAAVPPEPIAATPDITDTAPDESLQSAIASAIDFAASMAEAPSVPEPVASPAPPQPLTVAPSSPPTGSLSLGETLLARGMVTQPRSSKPDPLAPIRRMSQAEKIAFFS